MKPVSELIQERFKRWKGKENHFSRNVLVPLLTQMGFRDPRYVGGTKEKGIDVLYYEMLAPEDMPRFTGIQVKLEDITARVGKGRNPSALDEQIRQAFERKVGFHGREPFTRISSLVICTTGQITADARAEIEEGIHSIYRRLGAPIRFWQGSDLASFIEKYWLDRFVQLTGLNIPKGVQQVMVQGDSLTTGMALAQGGHNAAAIPLLERSLWQAALWLGTAHLQQGINHQEMLRAARTLIEFDKDHYNQFWLAGFAEFNLGHYDNAESYLEEASRILDADKSAQVQKGPGFQERYLQALGMLIEIARRRDKPRRNEQLTRRYRQKLCFITENLSYIPKPLGEWERILLKDIKTASASRN